MTLAALDRTVRRHIEGEIERLIAMLDLLDTDPDLEPDNDNEPWLGWPEGIGVPKECSASGDDREVEDENDEESDPCEFNGDEQDYNGDEFDTDYACLGINGESRV